MDGIDNITNFLISPERNIAILFLIEKFIQNTDYSKLYFYFKPFFEKYKDLLFNVLPEIIKNFKDSDKITDIIEKLFLLLFLSLKILLLSFLVELLNLLKL